MIEIEKDKCLGKIEWVLSEINGTNLAEEEVEIRDLLWEVFDKIKKFYSN